MSTIFYRKYNCSIEAPNFKGNIKTTTITSPMSKVVQTTGTDNEYHIAHYINPSNFPLLRQTSLTGMLTIYLSDNDGNYSHVVMAIINKTRTSNSITVYQKIGNIDFVEVIVNDGGPNEYVVFTTPINTNANWSFVGM